MGRIAFFTERLPPDDDPISRFSYDLMKTLADQQHEVRVFSTYREGAELPPARARIEILRPFKTWGWLELPRIIPLLLEFQPDVMHLIQPRAEALSGFTNAMSAIPAFSPLMGRPAVVASFYDLREDRLSRHRALLMTADAVTVSNRPQLELLEAYLETLKRKPFTAVVPVPSAAQTETPRLHSDRAAARTEEVLRELFASSEKVVFVPGDISERTDPANLFLTLADRLAKVGDMKVVFGGGWGDFAPLRRHRLMAIFDDAGVGDRVFLSGPLSPEALRFCLSEARVVLLAGLSMTSLRLTQVLSEALASGAVLMIDEDQALLAAVPWRDRENAFVVNRRLQTDAAVQAQNQPWASALREALASEETIERIRARLPDFARAEALDQPGNAVSRLYSRVLERKRPNLR